MAALQTALVHESGCCAPGLNRVDPFVAVSANNRFPFPSQRFPPCPRSRWGGRGCPPLRSRAQAGLPAGRARRASSPSASPPSSPSTPSPALPSPSSSLDRRERKRLGLSPPPQPPCFLHRWKNKERLASSQVAPGGPALLPASPPGSRRRLSPPAVLPELCRSSRIRPPTPVELLTGHRLPVPALQAKCFVVTCS